VLGEEYRWCSILALYNRVTIKWVLIVSLGSLCFILGIVSICAVCKLKLYGKLRYEMLSYSLLLIGLGLIV